MKTKYEYMWLLKYFNYLHLLGYTVQHINIVEILYG